MAAPKIGFQFDTQELESLVPSKAEMSVIGATVTAPAKQGGIEYNKLYSINSNDAEFYTALGVTGTAQATIRAAAKQLGQMQRASRMVINVVQEGAGGDAAAKLAATLANIKGDPVLKTGVHAFRGAAQKVNTIPRILIVPGYTSQRVGQAGNPVIAELASLCEVLLAVAPVAGPSTTEQAALDWRETIGSKRIIPTDGDFNILDTDGDIITEPNDAYIAGLINRVDELHGGLPFHSAGNREVLGVLGPSNIRDFSLTDGDTEGGRLLAADIGIITRGEGGDDFALAEGGTQYLGVSTASNESLWKYYNQVRGRDWIHITMLRTLRELLARYNLTSRLVQVYVNTIRKILADLAADERIYRDYNVGFTAAENSAAELRDGQITVRMAVEEPAPFLRGVIKSTRYEFAVTNFISQLEAQINTVAI